MLTEAQKELGWKEGTVAEFLGLSSAESQLVEIKLAMAREVRMSRVAAGLSQAELAERLATRQPSIARLEKAEGSATLDMMILAALEAGSGRERIAAVILGADAPSAVQAQKLGKPKARPVRRISPRATSAKQTVA